MNPNVQLRHFDYVLQVGTLPAGATLTEVPLQLDLDADFILRRRAVHYQSTTPGLAGQQALTNYFDRMAGPDSGDYMSQALLRFANENPDFGQYGSGLPVRPPVVYPRGGTITVDVQNQGDTDLPGLELYFMGQKMYRPGELPCRTYPDSISPLPFIYPATSFVNGLEVNYVTLAQQQTLRLLLRNVKNDADFAMRWMTIGSMNLGNSRSQYYQCYIQLKDQDEKPYSNLPVHVDIYGAFGSVTGMQTPFTRVGPYHPHLIDPEIYVPANNFLYYDLFRQDNYIGAGDLDPINLQIAFGGMKVFHR